MTPLKNIVVIYHAPCPDGFAAAYAAWRKFGDNASYLPAGHGQNFDVNLAGKVVYMLDFSLKRPQVEALFAQAKSFVILDHHKTAQEDLALLWRIEGGQLYVSMRSANDVDVGAIAKQYGGGGHKNAAAFQMDIKKPETREFMQRYLFS